MRQHGKIAFSEIEVDPVMSWRARCVAHAKFLLYLLQRPLHHHYQARPSFLRLSLGLDDLEMQIGGQGSERRAERSDNFSYMASDKIERPEELSIMSLPRAGLCGAVLELPSHDSSQPRSERLGGVSGAGSVKQDLKQQGFERGEV